MIRVTGDLLLDETEFEFRATTAQGPGGQHVNRSQTRIDVSWNVDRSASLNADQRRRIYAALATRINREGVLRVSSQKHRSQARNRDAAVERLVELVAAALHEDPARVATKPSRAAKQKRVEEKRQRSGVKKMRRKPVGED
jgi:ribosome-associated protein